MKKYRAVVVGAGRVGATYPEADQPRTHLGAYISHPRFDPVAVVECDPLARSEFQRLRPDFQGAVLESVHDLAAIHPEVISICVPPSATPRILRAILDVKPRLIFMEKPLATTEDDAENLRREILSSGIATAVNFHRNWDPAHERFFRRIAECGLPKSIRAVYGKGLFNYASHLIALLIRHFGDVAAVGVIGPPAAHADGDSSPSFYLRMAAGFDAHFLGIDDLEYDVLEMEVFMPRQVLSLGAGGCRRRLSEPVSGLFYPGYSQLADSREIEPDTQVRGLSEALDNFAAFLDGTTNSLGADLSLGLRVLDTLFTVRKQVRLTRQLNTAI